MRFDKNNPVQKYYQILEQEGRLTNAQREDFLKQILQQGFTYTQKQQLILGEKEGVDFWVYADPEYTCITMERLRKQLKKEGI